MEYLAPTIAMATSPTSKKTLGYSVTPRRKICRHVNSDTFNMWNRFTVSSQSKQIIITTNIYFCSCFGLFIIFHINWAIVWSIKCQKNCWKISICVSQRPRWSPQITSFFQWFEMVSSKNYDFFLGNLQILHAQIKINYKMVVDHFLFSH